ACVVERRIGPALPAAFTVPVGLTVSRKKDGGHAANVAMELGLEEKICVVTGSTAGIGLEVARQLQCEGAHVVTSGRREDGVGDLHVAADLSRAGEPGRLIAETINRFGRVDCLINNVGGTDIRTLDELTDDDWQSSFEINLMSAIRATQAALPGMRDRKSGVIVNVSSSAGK